MSNESDLRLALEQAVVNCGINYPTKYPNRPFTIPDGVWVRYTPLYAPPTDVSLNKLTQLNGVLQLDVFTPKKLGDVEAANIADQVRLAIRNKVTVGGVKVEFNSIGTTGTSEEDTWYKVMITANFLTFVDRRV